MVICFAKFPQYVESPPGVFVRKRTQYKDIDLMSDRSCQNACRVQVRAENLEVGLLAERSYQQLGMEGRIIGNEYMGSTNMPVTIVLHWCLPGVFGNKP
jgi:hypothetical protein